MSFGGGSPPPMIVPPAPAPAMQMMAPTTVKPPKTAQQPTFIGQALTPTRRQTDQQSLIGGTATAIG
jgi:hypothetical protein